MPAQSKMKLIEEREKRPMREILPEKYQKFGKQSKVATALGVSPATISQWLKFLGFEEKTIIVETRNCEQAKQ